MDRETALKAIEENNCHHILNGIFGDISLNYLEQNAELSVISPEFPDNRYSILSCIVFKKS